MSPRAEYGSGGSQGRGDRADPWAAAFGAHATDLADAVFLAALRRTRADTRRREPPRGADQDQDPPRTVTESGRDPAAGSGAGRGEGADASTRGADSATPDARGQDPTGPPPTAAVPGEPGTAEPPGTVETGVSGTPGARVSGTPPQPPPGTPVDTVHLPGDAVSAGGPWLWFGAGEASLEERQEFLAALRPFNLRLPQGPSDQVDLVGTARDYARALLAAAPGPETDEVERGVPIVPRLRARSLRAVDLVLIVDDGVTMLFQRGVAGAFSRLARDSGVFRSVRELRFDSGGGGAPVLRDSGDRPRVLAAPPRTGTRVVLVLTDGLGTAWRDRAFQEWLAGVAGDGAVAILHLLRPQLWRRGALRTVPTELSVCAPARPGRPNTDYVRERAITRADEEDRPPTGTVVPVLPLRPDAVHAWAAFVMGRELGRLWVHAAEFPAEEEHRAAAPMPPGAVPRGEPGASPPGPRAVPPSGGVPAPDPGGARVPGAAGHGRGAGGAPASAPGTGPGSDARGAPVPEGGPAPDPGARVPGSGGGRAFDPVRAVRRFHQTATRDAFELAVALAAVPLVPSMVGAVCEEVFGGPTPSELTEVYFSGLVARRADRDETGADTERWEFRDGVREALLSLGGRVPDIRRMLGLAAQRLGQVDPWFGDLARMLRGQRVERAEIPRTSRRWVNSMKPAMESISLFRNDAGSADMYADALSEPAEGREPVSSDVAAPQGAGLQSAQDPGSAHATTGNTGKTRNPVHSSVPSGEENGMSIIPSSGGMMNDSVSSPTAVSGGRSRGRPLNAVWVQVPRRNTAFTGREELLSALRSQLVKDQQQVITALNGMSGVGKTELAKEYLYRYAEDYDLICWFLAGHGNQLREAFASLAARLGLDSVGAGSEHVIQDVLEALRRGVPFGRWLLVFDNAQSREELEQYLPVGGEGHVIITSRDSSWTRRGGDTFLSVREFTRAESIELLKRRGPTSLTEDEADRLAEELGDLPLALNQAAVWLHESGMDPDEYLRQFAEKSTEMIQLLSPVDPDYPVPVAAAWNVSLDRLATTNPAALQLLQLCSFLATAPIPRSLFNFARQIDAPPELREALAEPARLGMAIRDIGRNSLAHISHRNNTISLHRLVQRAVQAPMSDEEREVMRHCAHQLLGHNDPQDSTIAAFGQYARLVPHVWASEAWNCEDPWVRALVIQMVRIALAGGEADEAERLASVSFAWWRRTLGEEHRNTLDMALQISKAMRDQGKLESARELCESTLSTLRRVHGEQAPEVLEAETEHVRNLRLAGRFKDSLTQAADIYRKRVRAFDEDDPLTLSMAHNLGYSLLLSGDAQASVNRYQDTLERVEAVLGPDHPRVVATVNGLAEATMELGHYREAERIQTDVVRRCVQVQGADGVGTLSNESVLAVLRRRIGDHNGAFTLSERTWQRFQAKQGVDSSNTLYAALIHALSLSAVNRHDEALELAEVSGERYVKLLGEEHPHVVAASVNRGIVLRRLGRALEAKDLDERALTLFQERLGNHHPSTLACRVGLANDCFLTGGVDRARELDEVTVEACRTDLGDRHPLTLVARRNLLVDLNTQGEDVSVEFEAVETAYRDVMGPDHPATLSIRQTVRGDADIFLTQM
ncbi:FxSxx-COOH system tetratricopeptide repeat protein [Nocardiopsis sp. NPDC050513]|uniref:FxSxx-COOH system tetratricopeptide repeat protein n=1 Tax=Nocardiopsis sp. NPDC050513 TaxID=3364338 RepID=UPI00379124C1